MVNEFEIKKQLCDIGKRIYNRNMVCLLYKSPSPRDTR